MLNENPALKSNKQTKRNIDSCKGPLVENCKECTQMEECQEKGGHYFIIVPQWIRNKYFPLLSGSSISVFLYLLQIANRKESSENFAKCWPSRKQIAQEAGVSKTNIDKQMRELEKHGLIKRTTIKSVLGVNNSWRTTRAVTICHMIRMKELRKFAGEKRLSLVYSK